MLVAWPARRGRSQSGQMLAVLPRIRDTCGRHEPARLGPRAITVALGPALALQSRRQWLMMIVRR